MRAYLKNVKHITSLMAFITALLVGMFFATVSNAVVVVNPGLGVHAVQPAFNPAFHPAFVNPAFHPAFVNQVNPFIARPFGFGCFNFCPAFNAFNPFFNADVDVGVGAFGFGFGAAD